MSPRSQALPSMSRRDAMKGAGALALAAFAGAATGSAEARLNILYIMSDDHAATAIGCYGGRLARLDPTPHLDALAQEGTIFRNAFAVNSICTPSRATILTGQHSHVNGVLDLDGQIEVRQMILPRVMSAFGYQTAMIGKWHLKTEPAVFEHYAVLPGQGKYHDPDFLVRGPKPWPENIVQMNGHSSDMITDRSLEWLRNRDRSRPFFLMHHFKAPHDMFQYAARYSDYLADTEIPEPASLYSQADWGSPATRGVNDTMRGSIGSSLSMRNRPRSLGLRLGIDPDLPDEVFRHRAYQEYLKRYLRCVKGVDDNVARLIDHLKATGEWDNTLIIYTSDQGMMLGEHDLIDKRWMFEESMRMPLILRDPRVGNSVPEVDAIINNTDFAPYMIERAGGTVPDEMQGESFAKLAAGQPQPEWRTATYYRYWMHRTHHDVPAHFGIRTDCYKLIFYYGVHYATPDPQQNTPRIFPGEIAPRWAVPTPPGWEFYDLKHDPEELHNRYVDVAYRDVIEALKAELARQRTLLGDTDEAYPHIAEIVQRHWND